MRQIQVIDNIHLFPMNQNNTAQVNPVPVAYMDSVQPSGALTGRADFIYKGTKDEAGALFSPTTDIPIPAWAKFFGYNRLVAFPLFETLAQDEFDFKFTLATGQINLSMQINWKNAAGAWQWDPNDPPKWQNTGFNVNGLVAAGSNNMNEFQARCSTDGISSWTLDQLSCNGKVGFTGPSVKVALKTGTGWAVQMAHWQEQAEVTCVPSYTIKSYLRTQLVMSDGAIPLGWF